MDGGLGSRSEEVVPADHVGSRGTAVPRGIGGERVHKRPRAQDELLPKAVPRRRMVSMVGGGGVVAAVVDGDNGAVASLVPGALPMQ